MSFPKSKPVFAASLIAVTTIFFIICTPNDHYQLPDHKQLAREYYQEDAQWYWIIFLFLNVPTSRSNGYILTGRNFTRHIFRVGDNGYVITEFINHVPWDREP